MASLESFLSSRIVIIITGHRDLFDEDTSLLKECIKERLMQIPGNTEAKVLVSALSPGADQLAAEVAFEVGMDVCIVLPMVESEYRVVSYEGENEAFLQLHGWVDTNPYVYRLNCERFQNIITDKYKAAKKRQQLLEEHAVKLASWADHLIVLWDGNDNGQLGGPAHIVRMARSGLDDNGQPLSRLRSDRPYAGRLHHLLTRRKSNLFPACPLGDATADAARRRKTWPYGTTSAADDLWYNKPFGVDGTWQTFLLPRYVPQLSQRLKFKQKLNAYYESLFRYAIPAFFFVLTVIVGGWGFQETADNPAKFDEQKKEVWWGDAWAKGAGLADPTTIIELNHPNWRIVTGRVLGLVTFFYGVGINLLFVFGDQGLRLFIWLFWVPKSYSSGRRSSPNGFNLICGLSEASYDLFLDLQSRGERVLILDADADKSPYKADCINQGAIVLAKDPVSHRVLTDFFVNKAKRIFAMMVNDTNNLRIIQQAYQLQDKYPSTSKVEWFAQAADVRIRDLLFESLQASKHINVTIYSFDLFTNIARRQLHDYPLDRFHLAPNQLKIARLVVFGFGPLAQKLVLLALQTGHYDQERRIFIRVYTSDATTEKRKFLARYPILNNANHDERIDPIRNEIFFNQTTHTFALEDVLSFEDLDEVSANLVYGGELLLRDIADDSCTSLYVCQEDGAQSIAMLREILPRIMTQLHKEHKPRLDVQVFAFYNFPNQAEEFLVEAQINRDFPDIPITFFGNYLESCSEATICRNAIDNLPELIHWHYMQYFTQSWKLPVNKGNTDQVDLLEFSKDLRKQWRNATESSRESSRLAADHLWVKYRLALAWFREYNADFSSAQLAMNLWLEQLKEQTETEIAKNALGERAVILWDDVPPVDDLAVVEHKRWSIERLLAGFRPLLWPADYTNQARLTQIVNQWNNDNAFKKSHQRQKIHLDLVPTSVLNRYVTDEESFQHREKYKDVQQVRGMALFFNKLNEMEWLLTLK